MKNALACPSLVLLALLDACASHPQQQPVDSTTVTAMATGASTDNGWQTLRVNYTACVQRQTDSGASGVTQTEDVIASALDACEGALHTVHDDLRNHLSALVSSSGARKAADRVTKGTREKTRVYLVGYADHVRYLAESHRALHALRILRVSPARAAPWAAGGCYPALQAAQP